MIKLKDVNFSPIIQENPVSTRDQLMKECWHEIKGLPKPIFENVWQGPIEVRLEELKVKMDKFEVKAEKLKAEYLEEQKKKADSEAAKAEKKKTKTATPATTATPIKKVLNPNFVKVENENTANQGSDKKQPQVLQYKPKAKGEDSKEGDSDDQEEPDKEAEDKPDSDMDFDSEELDDEYFEMNEEEKKAYKQKRERIKQAKIEDFKRRDNFQKQLKEVKLDTFKDRPDAITTIRCVHVEGNMFVVEWDAPSSNNSPIICYNVYLSAKKVKINHIQEEDEDQTEVLKTDLK